jgi:hypothetical protein
MKTEDKPKFLLAAEELARQRGTDAQEILRRNREAVRSSDYPGPDCLVPEEIESFFADSVGMEEERAEHARNCAGCSALLASAGVDPAEIERFLTQVRTRPRVRPAPSQEVGQWEGGENNLRKKVRWTMATLGSLFAFGSLLRLFRRRSSHGEHKTSNSEEAMTPISAKEI